MSINYFGVNGPEPPRFRWKRLPRPYFTCDLSVSIPQHLVDRLKQEARLHDTSVSQLLTFLLAYRYEDAHLLLALEHGVEPPPQRYRQVRKRSWLLPTKPKATSEPLPEPEPEPDLPPIWERITF